MVRKTKFLTFLLLAFSWGAPQAIGQMVAVKKNLCATSFPSDARIEWTCAQAANEKALADLGSRMLDVMRFNRIDRMHALRGAYLKIPVKLDDVIGFTPLPAKLDQAKGYPRYIFIDRSEEFLGAYEFGELKFSLPVASGFGVSTPTGTFRILGRDRWAASTIYPIRGTNIPYPMHWGIKFHVTPRGVSLWLHSRDLPGYPASHGCVGLYDEEMEQKFFNYPPDPQMMDSERLYQWIFPEADAETPREYPGGMDGILIEIK